ncbi:LysM peptidoglycan-binding domain-containing protein [Kineococcus sp. SYSU DK005]|uniref:LysM peptidoglycan-binding domain-containing protein n=1 Tax=Kineococcus sp. SYSU DK005 TaxID=3383126 RepID=UPI003D7EFE40
MSSTALAPLPRRSPVRLPAAALPARAARPARRGTAPARRAAARPPVRAAHGPAAPARLRLTRRGRLALTCTAAGVLTGVVLAVAGAAGGPAAAERAPGAGPRVVTVLPGQTLSGIAAELAPGQDWREVAADIAEANGLATQALLAGQRLLLPGER